MRTTEGDHHRHHPHSHRKPIAASVTGTDVDSALVQRGAPRRRKATPKAAPAKDFATAAAEIIATTVEQPTKADRATKPARVRAALMPVEGCSCNHDGLVTPRPDHKTYASDPHCRAKECDYSIAACEVHVLEKGGKVVVESD